MNRFFTAVILLTICATTSAWAEDIGIQFIASNDLGNTATKRKITQDALYNYVDVLNAYYRNSRVALRAKIMQIEYAKISSVSGIDIINDMKNERNGFEAMFNKAQQYGADYTIAVVSQLLILGKPGCGRAYAVNQSVAAISDPRRAFAVIHFFCGAHTLAHELGHLMGLNHGSLVDACNPNRGHTSAIAPYANGYAVGNCDGKLQPGEFGDIMVGGNMRTIMGNDKGNLHIFSNPRLHDERCGFNKTCGDTKTGDAARALNENAHYYASHTKSITQSSQ